MNEEIDKDKKKCKGGYLYQFFIIMRIIIVVCGTVHFFHTGKNLTNPIDILVFIGMLILPEFYFVIAAFGCNSELVKATANISKKASLGTNYF